MTDFRGGKNAIHFPNGVFQLELSKIKNKQKKKNGAMSFTLFTSFLAHFPGVLMIFDSSIYTHTISQRAYFYVPLPESQLWFSFLFNFFPLCKRKKKNSKGQFKTLKKKRKKEKEKKKEKCIKN